METNKKVLLFFIITFIFISVISLKYVRKRPNVILLHIETTRADHLSCYGYKRNTTPHICQVAEDGVLFENAHAHGGSTYITIPSIYFSLYPHCHSVKSWFGQINEIPYLFEIFKDNGYKTNFLVNFIPKNGWKRLGFNAREMDSEEIISNIENLSSREPAFVGIHYNGCHKPYFKPNENFEYFDEDIKINKTLAYDFLMSNNQKKKDFLKKLSSDKREKMFDFLINRFDESLKETDSFIGNLISELKERGLYKNSLIIITADHGEYLAEEDIGKYFHNGGIYNEVTYVPLIIKFPNNKYSNKRVPQLTRQIDILPTILDYLNIKTQEKLQGQSLLPAIEGKELNLEVFSNSRGIYSLRTKKFNYIYIDVNETVDYTYRHIKQMFQENIRIKKLLEKYNSSESIFKNNSSRNIFKKSLRRKILNNTGRLYNLDGKGDEGKIIRNKTKKNEFKRKTFEILNSCPKSSPEFSDKTMGNELKKNLKSLGYLSS